MSRGNPSKRHWFPRDVMLLAVRWYCRHPLSCRDVQDMLAERGIAVGASIVHRWVRKFGPEIRKRGQPGIALGEGCSACRWDLRSRGRALARPLAGRGSVRPVDRFPPHSAAGCQGRRAFLRQARETVRCYPSLAIITDKARCYAKVIGEINGQRGPEDAIRHIDRKYLNNRIESVHAALKQRLRSIRRF